MAINDGIMRKFLLATSALALFAACTPTSIEPNEDTSTELFREDTFRIPASHHNLSWDDQNRLIATVDGEVFTEVEPPTFHVLSEFRGAFRGSEKGLSFNFGTDFDGTLYFGFIPFEDYKHPQPVFFKRPAKIESGKGEIDIDQLRGKYDMIGWEESGHGVIGYRVADADGSLLYEGRIAFSGTGPFETAATIIEGPFVHNVGPDSVQVSWLMDRAVEAQFSLQKEGSNSTSMTISIDQEVRHEGQEHLYVATISGLDAGSDYRYSLLFEGYRQEHGFKTAPAAGSQEAFTFAYCSDSRNGQGGGERNLYGANAYIMKKMMALATQQEAAFMQFSGDLIDGYLSDGDEMDLQYANWKRSVESFLHYMPVYVSFGNHESLNHPLISEDGGYIGIDRMPYDTESGEEAFTRNFINPIGLTGSEDGMSYDPNPETVDFPKYDETVFHYTYGNVAVVVLNSNYWYATNKSAIDATSGGQHAYIMDRQLEWFRETILALEEDDQIDHVFVTQHTPCFPNGGHVKDDMWYHGNNEVRTWVAGKPLEQGILERRDELLELMINKSSKVRAILTGDEHNYCKTEISPGTEIYPEDWDKERVEISRTIWQINNGAAGAPYYAQEETPWTEQTSGFTTQNALVLIDVEGDRMSVRVLNPDTLEEVDRFDLI